MMGSACRVLAASSAAFMVLAVQPAEAAESDVVEVAVFGFALDDRSAGGGIVHEDPIDTENLKASTEEARRMLSASGLFSAVDTSSAADEVMAAGGIQHCNGCEVALAKELGADSLRYLPVDSIATAIGLDATHLCRACITGKYPTPAGQELYQIALHNNGAEGPGRTYEMMSAASTTG